MLAEWFTWGIIEATSAEEVLKWKIISYYQKVSQCALQVPLLSEPRLLRLVTLLTLR